MARAGEIPGVEVELVREFGALRQLDTAWRDLAVVRGNAFVTPEWFWAWHRHYGHDHEPLVGVVRDADGGLRGLLPLVARAGRARTARFAGSALGDHFHPVALPQDDAAVAAAVGSALRSESRVPRVVVAENVHAGANWWRELSRSSGCGSNPVIDRRSILPCIQLRGCSWEEYLASRSRNLRSQLGRKRRALERDHDVVFRWTGPDDDVGEDMASLFRLHDMRWEARPGASSSLTSARARAFHTDFASAAHRHGWLRLGFLEVDSEPVAAWYGWRLGACFAYYQAGFDPSWSSRNVGTLLFAESIRAAIEEGAAEYDMLLGEEEFKARFANAARPVCTVVIAPRMRPARLIAATEMRIRRAGRRLPESLREPTKRRARALLERLPMARPR